MSLPKKEVAEQVALNQGLVCKYARYYSRYGVDFDELVAEGNLGLMLAAQKFDPKRKLKFITYAIWWVRARMTAVVEKAHNVHNSTRLRKVFWKGARARNALIAAGLDGTPEEVGKVLGLTPDLVEHAMMCMTRPVRIDKKPSHDDDDRDNLHHLLPPTEGTPETAVVARDLGDKQLAAMQRAVAHLSPKARKVIQHRFLREDPLTLQQTGNLFGISRERVRQIEAQALRKMRALMQEAA